ncbi:MAG: hypothetical protein EWV75_19400 [Microcystis wesenbergii Mw_QC_S_20081001_S30D]|uniref:Uncharacterized protein n=1 Tax=Microcystis wesenbergii Mw_QC_S_20081001_S30D TaxID=2486245 RepID=A0A552JB85_9CHRO|nr:MAG: hypothetical protein EWV75_19400 [Microcystis wesenbergii Mw_QC_S_20081001_S30D]
MHPYLRKYLVLILAENHRNCPQFLKINRVCLINLKTLLGKTFRPFGHQKVPTLAVIGGKIQVLFP